MRLEERVASAVRAHTEALPPASTDVSAIRSAAKAQSRRRTAAGLACAIAAAAVVAASVADLGSDRSQGVDPVTPSSDSPTPSASSPATSPPAEPLTGPASWTAYTSREYGFRIGHPPSWTVTPAARAWSRELDVRDWRSQAQLAFYSPAGDVRVGAWVVPLEPGTGIDWTGDIVTWVEDYCRASGDQPCAGIADRAVDLCIEKWDCHPGLLVPFKHDVLAFFSGGIYDADAMTVVGVMSGEDAPSVARYGGAQRLLERFLSTMQVWPESTPRNERR